MDVYHILLGRPWQFDRNAVHEGKMNVYSFDMNGQRHGLHSLRRQKEKFSDKNQFLMLNEKEFLEESRMTESEVNVISQASYLNEFEIMMDNEMCNDWLMKEKDQQVMTNAGYVMMEEAYHNVVMKEGKGSMLGEIAKGSDVMEDCGM